jgi:hypothetical protein
MELLEERRAQRAPAPAADARGEDDAEDEEFAEDGDEVEAETSWTARR